MRTPIAPIPGDTLLPDADVTYNSLTTIHRPQPAIWPWLLQLGKNRAGWYLPSWLGTFLPTSWKASRALHPEWQNLAVGDQVPGPGPAVHETLEVLELDPERALVYRGEMFGCVFTWALLLRRGRGVQAMKRLPADRTVVHLRFRAKIAAMGWKMKVGERVGSWVYWLGAKALLAGLRERVGKQHAE